MRAYFYQKFGELLNQEREINVEKFIRSTSLEFGINRLSESELKELHMEFTTLITMERFYTLLNYNFEEIIFHNWENYQVIGDEIDLKLCPNEYFYKGLLDLLCLQNKVSWNYTKPFTSFGITYNETPFRLTLIHNSALSSSSPKIFIRKLNNLKNICFNDSKTPILQKLITEKSNIVFCGKTGSGKTTILKKSLEFINPKEHIITIEDTYELKADLPYLTQFISDSQGNEKSMLDYCQYAMRMRPDRVILGEIRGAEIIPFVSTMNTGHKGMLCSLHAKNAKDAIKRMATLYMLYADQASIKYETIMSLIASNIDYVFYLEDKKIVEIVKILGSEDGHLYFETIS